MNISVQSASKFFCQTVLMLALLYGCNQGQQSPTVKSQRVDQKITALTVEFAEIATQEEISSFRTKNREEIGDFIDAMEHLKKTQVELLGPLELAEVEVIVVEYESGDRDKIIRAAPGLWMIIDEAESVLIEMRGVTLDNWFETIIDHHQDDLIKR